MSTDGATRQSPLERIICASCRRNYSPSQFYLSSCPHVLCATCLYPPPSLPPPTLPSDTETTCPACDERTQILKLEFYAPSLDTQGNEQLSALRHCFRPLGELVDELGMAAEFQTAGLVEQIDYLTDRVGRQRNVLDKVQVELKAHKSLKLKFEETRAENDQLRHQLEERNQVIAQLEQGSLHPFEAESRKRKAVASPPLQDFPRRAPSNISRTNSRASHQNAPPPPVQSATRLTLSPRLVHAHEARELQANLARENGGGFARGRGSMIPSPAPAVRGPTPLSARERIAEFAYDPNRLHSTHSPALQDYYEPPPPPRQSHSRSYQNHPHPHESNHPLPPPHSSRDDPQQAFNYPPGPSYAQVIPPYRPSVSADEVNLEFGNGSSRQRTPFVGSRNRSNGSAGSSSRSRGIEPMPASLRQSFSSMPPPTSIHNDRSRQRQSFPPPAQSTPRHISSNPRSASVNSHHTRQPSQQPQQQQPRGSTSNFRPASTTGVRGASRSGFDAFVTR